MQHLKNYTLAAKDPKQQNKVLDVGHFIRYDTIRHDGIRVDEQQAYKEGEEEERTIQKRKGKYPNFDAGLYLGP